MCQMSAWSPLRRIVRGPSGGLCSASFVPRIPDSVVPRSQIFRFHHAGVIITGLCAGNCCQRGRSCCLMHVGTRHSCQSSSQRNRSRGKAASSVVRTCIPTTREITLHPSQTELVRNPNNDARGCVCVGGQVDQHNAITFLPKLIPLTTDKLYISETASANPLHRAS